MQKLRVFIIVFILVKEIRSPRYSAYDIYNAADEIADGIQQVATKAEYMDDIRNELYHFCDRGYSPIACSRSSRGDVCPRPWERNFCDPIKDMYGEVYGQYCCVRATDLTRYGLASALSYILG